LILAALLTRWMPPTTGRGLALWSACLFSHGTLWSVRFALLDVPSLTLTTLAVAAVEKGRPLLSAAIIGIAGLGRETNLLALASQPIPRDRRTWARLPLVAFLAVLPMLIWLDYLRSIYRSTLLAHTDQLTLGTGLIKGWQDVIFIDVKNGGLFSLAGVWLCLLISLGAQAVYLLVRREYETPWWRVAIVYALLMVFLDRVLADPNTGAITRVLLPMTVGFNVLLASETRWTRFWPWFALGNLHLLGVATFKGL